MPLSPSLSLSQVRLLFDLASLPPVLGPSSLPLQRRAELQMQMLYVLGRLAERRAPTAFFNFDGVGASVRLAPLTRFPGGKAGYSFCCWVRVNSFFEEVRKETSKQTERGERERVLSPAPCLFLCVCVPV